MRESLGDLIKHYEDCYNFKIPKRFAYIIRLDMRAGHSFTRGFDKPYDNYFIEAMQQTMLELCKNVSGCQFGYVQSDEISLLVYETNPEAEPWFANRVQKIVSISASMATLYFNRAFNEILNAEEQIDYDEKIVNAHNRASKDGALFDSRVFAVPENVIHPYFIWRQNDCTRNSILGLAQKHFSHKEIQGLKCNDLQNKLLTEKDINWNNETVVCKRGTCAYRVISNPELGRRSWILDKKMPVLMDDKEFVLDKVDFFEQEQSS